eukprot:tig00021352_g20688.t1
MSAGGAPAPGPQPGEVYIGSEGRIVSAVRLIAQTPLEVLPMEFSMVFFSAVSLHDFAREDTTRELVVKHGGLTAVIHLLHSGQADLATVASHTVLTLATDPKLRLVMGESPDLIPALVGLVGPIRAGDSFYWNNALLEAATGALQNLCAHTPGVDDQQHSSRSDRRMRVHDAGAVQRLSTLLASNETTVPVKRNTLWALCNLSMHERIARTVADKALDPILRIIFNSYAPPPVDAQEQMELESVALFCLNSAAIRGGRRDIVKRDPRLLQRLSELEGSQDLRVRTAASELLAPLRGKGR